MRNRTYGGVRGRKTKVGRKLLRFPPTRLVIFVIYISAFSSFISSAVIPVISMIDASSIPFASTSSWQFQGFAGTCLLPCLQLCLFPYLLPFLSGTCHPGGTGASWHQSQGLLSFLYRHQKTQKP